MFLLEHSVETVCLLSNRKPDSYVHLNLKMEDYSQCFLQSGIYRNLGTGLRVYFPALKSALIDQPKAPKHQNTDKHGALDDAMVLRIIEKIKEQPDISQEALGESIGVTRRVVQKYINVLKESGRIERVGGKRYGHWKIND